MKQRKCFQSQKMVELNTANKLFNVVKISKDIDNEINRMINALSKLFNELRILRCY